MMRWLAVLALVGCGSEYGLSSTPGPEGIGADPSVRVAVPRQAGVPDEAPPEVWEALPSHGGSTVEVRQLQGSPVREETHRFGSDAPTLTDVLFVVDGSTSMRRLVESVRRGMAELSEEGVFPANTQIAVTNMTPPSGTDSDEVLRTVKRRQMMRLEPGFAGLVDADRLADARETLGQIDEVFHDRLAAEGCSAWFEPTERGPDGVPCLVAHTQILEAASGVEAGLTSLGMFALTTPDLFREGAAVNIVFVSDTHDPGLPPDHENYAGMMSVRPDPARLAAAIVERFPVASVRMHAIAPAEPCTFESFNDPIYFEAAQVTGGATLDICGAGPADYVELIRSIAIEGSRPTRAVLALGADADEVESVTVGGRPVGFRSQGRAVFLYGALPDRAESVKVRYRASATPRVRTR
jgi:hypothetical protein